MTFEELNEQMSAVRLTAFAYHIFKRSVEIELVPEYGMQQAVKDKQYHLKFDDCLYVGCRSERDISPDGKTIEFITLGEEKNRRARGR